MYRLDPGIRTADEPAVPLSCEAVTGLLKMLRDVPKAGLTKLLRGAEGRDGWLVWAGQVPKREYRSQLCSGSFLRSAAAAVTRSII